jgi:glycosyltransferase involved in cell wall biosynthesis
VVATFNSGSGINRLIDSLDRQSLPTDQFEVIFVDDGSTDGTAKRLRRLAASRPNVRTTQIPNSGWPGKPRNIGLDLATGEYVFFADHDDFFGDEALERMYDYAKANNSDVLVAREQRVGRSKPFATALFTQNRPRVDLSWGPLLGLLTPHKLFRRAFLLEHGLRFPEGKRRLEDHALVVPAYFAAEVISVLADYPCYFWVHNGEATNYSHGIDPETYYPHLVEVLDVVEANTEPGPRRDALLARWYNGKVLGLIERSTARSKPHKQDALLAIAGELSRTRFASCDSYLGPVRRVLSALLRAGENDRVVALGQALARLRATPVVHSAQWRDGALHVDVSVTMHYADGDPITFRREDGRIFWVSPIDVGEHVDASLLDMTDALAKANIHALVRHSELGIITTLAGQTTQSLTEDAVGRLTLSLAHQLVVDIRSGEREAPLRPGRWQLRLVTGMIGLYASEALPGFTPLPQPALVDGTPVVPVVSKNGNLALAVDVPQVSLVRQARLQPGDVSVTHGVSGSRLVIELPQVHVSGDGERRCAVHVGKLAVPGRLAVGATGRARVESWLSALPGRHSLSVELGGQVTALGLDVVVAPHGRVRLERAQTRTASTKPFGNARLRANARRVPGLRRAYRAVRRRVAVPRFRPASSGEHRSA